MTLDEAIKHCKEKSEELNKQAKSMELGFPDKTVIFNTDSEEYHDCLECAKEHEQLAEWLTQLKEIKEAYESDYQIQDLIETCVKFWG